MKIVDICAFFAPEGGGVRTYVEQKLAAGPRLGHEIVIVAPGASTRTEARGPAARIEWIRAPLLPLDRRYRYFDSSRLVHSILDRERPDFVEASSPWRSAAAVASWRGAAPRAFVMHADPMAAYAYRWLEGVARPEVVDRGLGWAWNYLRRLDQAFELTVSASDSLTSRLSAAGLRGAVTHRMGVEPGIFSPALRDNGLRERMLRDCALPAEATLLIGVGRHAPEKRWPMIVQAVMKASVERPIGLLLIGDGRERTRLLAEVRGNPHIRLLAPMPRRELARLMASCDALVHGCESETFSMVAAEAVASGLPVIVPDRGGASDHARAGGGLCFAAADAEDAARTLRVLIDRGWARSSPTVRTMTEHFAELFAHYASLTALKEAA